MVTFNIVGNELYSILIKMQAAHLLPSTHSLCGPFDQQFLRKFRDRKSHSMSIQHLKLAKLPNLPNFNQKGSIASSPNILPKLKEIEKLAKSERKRPQKTNKYVDGVSEL